MIECFIFFNGKVSAFLFLQFDVVDLLSEEVEGKRLKGRLVKGNQMQQRPKRISDRSLQSSIMGFRARSI